MTNTYNTGNPLGSTDPRDLLDNASNLDDGMNSALPTFTDRLGVQRDTWAGQQNRFNLAQAGRETAFTLSQADKESRFQAFLVSSGYVSKGDYAASVVLAERNEYVAVDAATTGTSPGLYRPNAAATLPLTLTGTWATDSANLVLLGDDVLRQELSDSVSPEQGAALIGYLGRSLADRLGETMSIADGPDAVAGDGTPEDRLRLIAKLDAAAAAGKPLIVPAKIYQFHDWIPLPDKCKLVFMPGARWVLTERTSLGGFVAGGCNLDLSPRPFTDVEIFGIDLDCGNIAGENGFNALNADNVKVFNPKIRNAPHDPIALGGRAFQFEGGSMDGIHVYQPYIENCSIGINSQADPSGGVNVARHITYHDVVMRNVDVPFNVDGQFASPEAGVPTNMSTTVRGADLFNCGRLLFPGAVSPVGGGIICGDRGFGLHIDGLRVVNTVDYGAIGALVRGTVFGVKITNVHMQVPSMTAVFDFTMPGFGVASSAAHPCTVDAEGVTVIGNLDYIVKGGLPGKVGKSKFDVRIDSTAAALAGLCDSDATVGGLGYLDLTLLDSEYNSTGMQSLLRLFLDGNSTALCLPRYQEGTWTPTDASGAGLTLAVAGTPRYVRNGRLVTALMQVTYPETADAANALIGGLPFVAANFAAMAGTAAVGYTTEPTLNAGYVAGGSSLVQPSTNTGLPLTNAELSGDSVYMTITYLA